MTDTLLDHLESEKGDQGLYMTDRQAAINNVTDLLTTSSTSNPVNAKQVDSKFQKLFERSRNPKHTQINSLFVLGRTALRSPYNRRLPGSSKLDDDELTLSHDHSSSGESSTRKRPRRPTRKRPSLETPTSSLKRKSK